MLEAVFAEPLALWAVLLRKAHAAKVEPLVRTICMTATSSHNMTGHSVTAGRCLRWSTTAEGLACLIPGFSQAIISPNEMRWQWQYLGSLGSAEASANCSHSKQQGAPFVPAQVEELNSKWSRF
jgi:hypothetical protein